MNDDASSSAEADFGADLARFGDPGSEIARRARAAGVVVFVRAQQRSVRRVVVREGRPESASSVSSSGCGIQVVDEAGYSALASRDDLRADEAVALFERVRAVAARGPGLGLDRAELPTLPLVRGRRLEADPARWSAIDLAGTTTELAELERSVRANSPGVALQLSYRAELDEWRILRSDGSDTWFRVPRCTLGLHATSAGDRGRHGVSSVVFSTSPDLHRERATVERFLRRADTAARLARELPDAPAQPAGSFPLIIDYALAKGLAHEAFGHASEADSYRSSILACEGRLRLGEQVGASHVSIVDEPVEGDHAWQPFSANALVRERAVIVDHGRLVGGLSDPWSAARGGVPLTGAARAESFHHAPQPRMSNIRIEVDDPLPAPGAFEDYGPARVRDLIAEAGLFRRHACWRYLAGYSGGQVNPTTGDFVFQCKAIYALTERDVVLHRPAIFSGSMFGALRSLREAFGPLELDAIGYCGKWGQSVPSSGGSHRFLALEPDASVRLGGR